MHTLSRLLRNLMTTLTGTYCTCNVVHIITQEGIRAFCSNTWNLFDLATVLLSLLAIVLHVLKLFVVLELTKEVAASRGNAYVRLTYAAVLNKYYEYIIAATVFTSTIKFTRLLSFQKAFMQIAATMKLCFQVRKCIEKATKA